jgi:hypothetical protein
MACRLCNTVLLVAAVAAAPTHSLVPAINVVKA